MMSTTPKKNRYIGNQRRQTLASINSHFFNQNPTPSFSVPLLIDTMNTFHQSAEAMEEEIMLPLRLKDIPVEGKNEIVRKTSSFSLSLVA